MPANSKTKKTILTLTNNKKNNEPTVLVTAYDYPQARIADMSGVDCILIGDSMGMTTLGHKTTIPVTMDNMIGACEAVSRGANNALIIGDMPYMSYQPSDQVAVENAGRFIVSGCDMVKVEGAMTDRIKAICDAGIMVMSHLGLTPHTRAKLGGYRVQGKTAAQAEIVLEQARKLQDAGCSALLLEAMPKEPAGMIAREYVDEVRNRQFPSQENFYEIKEEELEKLLGDSKWKYETDQGFPTNHSATPNNVTEKK